MKQKRKQWTQQEKDLLKKIYPTYSWGELTNIFQTSKDCITHKAKQLRIKREMVNFAKWTQEDIKYLKEEYGKTDTKTIAENLGRTTSAVVTKADKLGLKTRNYWSEEEIELLKEVFPKYGNQELVELYFNNRSEKAIDDMGQKLGLLKEDLPPQKQKQFTKEQLLEDIKNVYKKLGRTPLLTELRLYGLPSERTINRYFKNGYRGICKEMGWKINNNLFGKNSVHYSKNGDICLSWSELIITNFFIDNSIDYIKDELLYKDIFQCEEFGQKRIDWLIKDRENGFVVEYFGMAPRWNYKEKMNKKIELCKKYNIPLIALYPEDIKRLPEIFKDFIK